MILQRILLPNKEICDLNHLYIRPYSEVTFDIENQQLLFPYHSVCTFNTYFNSFTLHKWKKYTSLQTLYLHLKVKGKFIVQINRSTILNKKLATFIVYSEQFENEAKLPIDIERNYGVISFTLICVSEEGGEFVSGEFITDDEPRKDLKILMSVCTFRREEYILANLRQIEEKILNNKESPLKDCFDVFVSDNGNTLPLEGFNKHITIKYNKNTGGAGGFTRGMMELINRQDEGYNYSHILLTDDDIKLDPAALEKTFAFISYIKDEYREAFIGGSMFRTDKMDVQNELANRWEAGKVIPLKHNVNMSTFDKVVRNELPDRINYFSWWYCCMPAGVVNRVNLPLPIFIKRDDIEYGLRNGSLFITLNGINVWHEPFEGKRPAYLEYYYIRNQLIMESTLGKNMSSKSLIKKTKKRLLDDVAKFHYLEFKFYCEGILDYCKGIDFFKSIDAVNLNNVLRGKDRKFLPLEQLEIPFDEVKYRDSFPYNEKRSHLIFRRLTLNGWLLPAKKEPAIVQSAFPRKLPFYRVKKALQVEYISQTGYVSEKSWRELIECFKLYRKTIKAIKKYYRYAVREFVDRWHEIISYDFWNNYLFNEPVPTTKNIPDMRVVKTIPRAEMIKLYVGFMDSYLVDSHIVYLESRKATDFASNIFAVAKELNKPQYKDYKVYLAFTKESKALIESKIKQNKLENITLVEKDSKEFLKVMATAKYFFTDFHLFPQFVKREGQVVVSLWHGTPLKTLGKDCKSETQASVQRIFYLADYQVYPGKFMEEKMLDVYWLNNIYQGKILETGYPRNGLLFDENRRKEIRDELNLDGKTAIMYMPTFRGSAGDNKNDEQAALIAKFFDELDAKLTDNQIFYIKLHNYNTSSIDCKKYKHIVEAPSQYDNYELQSACDIMVTDYSSVFFDFAVSRRKIILFQYDQEEYLTNRGVCIPLDELPFPIVKDIEGLVKEINLPIEYDDKAFLEKYATFDNINASKMLCERVILGKELPKPYVEKNIEHNGKKNIFIYTGSLRTRQSSLAFWDLVNKLDFSKANYFLLYYDPVMWKNAYRLLPMNENFSQIGMWSYTSMTKEEEELRRRYIIGRDISPEVKEPLMKMYKRELIKHFGGQVECDTIVLWGCVDPGLACMYDTFAKHRVSVYPDGFGIYDKALVDSLQNYHYVTYSEFLEFMDEEKYESEEIKHFVEPVPEENAEESISEEADEKQAEEDNAEAEQPTAEKQIEVKQGEEK